MLSCWKGLLIEKHFQIESNCNSHRHHFTLAAVNATEVSWCSYINTLLFSIAVFCWSDAGWWSCQFLQTKHMKASLRFTWWCSMRSRSRRVADVSSVTARVSENDMKVEWGARQPFLFAPVAQAGARREERDNTSRLSNRMKKSSKNKTAACCSSCSSMAAALSRMGCF